MSQHTPGPWIFCGTEAEGDHGNVSICTYGVLSLESQAFVAEGCSKADAMLIAAAPDLFEAAIGLLERFDPKSSDRSATLDAISREYFSWLRQAVTKAIGEAP
jgi:hypothetical protein